MVPSTLRSVPGAAGLPGKKLVVRSEMVTHEVVTGIISQYNSGVRRKLYHVPLPLKALR